MIRNIWYCYNIGGINFVLCKIKDKLTHSNNSHMEQYKILSLAKPEQYKHLLKYIYKDRTGSNLRWKCPQTFNEKIQWLKLYDSTPLKTMLVDKYLVRKWVEDRIGGEYLIPLIGVWDDFDEIKIEGLPDKFVLKATHGSGWNVIVKDKNKVEWGQIRDKFKKWLGLNFAYQEGLELQYLNVPPKIIAEEYVENLGEDNLYDYKIHCFNGKPMYIQVIGDRDPESHTAKEAFYNTNWERQDFTYTYPRYETEMKKPDNLIEMLRIASNLSENFIYVRVDLYILNKSEIKFGEMTFTPTSGYDSWSPPKANRLMGDLLILPREKYETADKRE